MRWYSDGGYVRYTSMVWLKELPRAGRSPLLFVHMAKPFADGRTPEANQTFVLERRDDGWSDVAKSVMPGEVDMTMHFRTRKDNSVIEVAPWKEYERQDTAGKAYTYGDRVMDLRWKREKFIVEKPSSKTLTNNY